MKKFTLLPSEFNLEDLSDRWVLQSSKRYVSFLISLTLLVISVLTIASVWYIENRTIAKFQELTTQFSFDWLTVEPNGTKLKLSGAAPDQIEYLGAISLVNLNFNPDGIINNIIKPPTSYVPKQSLDIQLYSKDDTILIFGTFPNQSQRSLVLDTLRIESPEKIISDFSTLKMTDTISGTDTIVAFAARVLSMVSEGVVSISGQTVSVTSHLDTQNQIELLATQLRSAKPDTVELDINLSYPLPLVKPYRFGIYLDGQNTRLEICHAEDRESADRIVALLHKINPNQDFTCKIALGSPSAGWIDLIEQLLEHLHVARETYLRLSDFSVILLSSQEFSQAEILSLEGIFSTPPGKDFNLEIINSTENATALNPDVLSVSKDLDNKITVIGALQNNYIKKLVLDIISAYFVDSNVNDFTLIADESNFSELDLFRTGIISLSLIDNGELLVLPEEGLILSGKVSSVDKFETLNRYINSEFQSGDLELNVVIDENLIPDPPLSALECDNGVTTILTNKKITFDPGSVEINQQTGNILSELAEVLIECSHISWEIGGHTDSQGSNKMNLELSTKRAESVLRALDERDVPIENITAKGYGESMPIATNNTSAGREKNRRIVIQIVAIEPAN